MSENGKGSKRRPTAVPQQTYLRNFENTFGPRPAEQPADAGTAEETTEHAEKGARG